MGYQDREYYQEDRTPSGFQLGGDLSYTWRIVIINAGLFLANFFLFSNDREHDLRWWLSVHGDTVIKPYLWWQFLTYGFIHSLDIQHIFWNMFGLVVFGSAIEETYGRREYLRFYLLSILCGGVFWGLRVFLSHRLGWELLESALPLEQTMMLGASGGITALTLLFCLRNPFATVNLMFVLPVPAWVLGMIVIIGDVFQVGQAVGTVAHDVHLCGALFAIAYFYFHWNLTRALNFSWLSRATNSLGKLVKPRPKLRVFEGDEDDEGVYRELETEADRILVKISHDGEGSLSTQERQTLERYSRLMRQKHR
jgi:membrane associated rhomboid family serine protease